MQCSYMTDVLLRALDELVESGCLTGKKVILFGLNAPAFVSKHYLESKGIEIFGFVDNGANAIAQFNNPDIAPTFHHMFRGKRLTAYRPEELPEEYHDDYVFLLYSKYEQEMFAQLEGLGYKQGEQAFLSGGFWKTENLKRSIVPEGAGAMLTPEEIKEYQMAGLRYVHRLCEENGLNYYLHYGSLLGSVRHKGYIPWDDDLDILMFNEDMLKLIEIIKEDHGRYDVFYNAYNDPVRAFIARVEDRETVFHQWDIPLETYGGLITLDIFPMAGMPAGEEAALAYYMDVLKYAWEYDDLTVEFPEPTKEIQDRRAQCKQYVLDKMLEYPAKDSEFLFTIPTKPGKPLIFRREYWDEKILLPFEGEKFYGPKNYDAILAQHYGDYMTPPPANRQVSIHRTTVFHKKEA